jgi:hypothetical protein
VRGPAFKAALPRFLLGLAGAVAAGLVVFRGRVFDPGDLSFQCVSVGALTAGLLALVRISRHGGALLLVVLFGLARYGFAGTSGWLPGISGFLLGAGLYLVAVIFDLLGRSGLALGKFLLAGPLIGGIYLALTPITDFYTLTSDEVTRTLLLRFLVGLILGDGAGLGVELAELPAAAAAARRESK